MRIGTIEFDVLSPDDGDGLYRLQFNASNGSFSAAQDFYSYADEFVTFGQSLAAFPAKAGDTTLLEIGSMEGRSAYYCSMRAYTFDAVGHSALEVIIDNRRDGQYLARAAFQIHCEIAAINRLGNALQEWTPKSGHSLIWKSVDARL